VIAEHKAREDKKEKGDKEKKKPASPKPISPVPSPAPAPAPAPAASHRKFALHRQIFDMRRDDIKRKEQGVKAREVGKGEFWDRCDIWDWSEVLTLQVCRRCLEGCSERKMDGG
jgi:hypothetical protein